MTEIEEIKLYYLKKLQIILSSDEEKYKDLIAALSTNTSSLTEEHYKLVNGKFFEENEKKFEFGGIVKLLRFLQLFCEGHNFELQNYLRLQLNHRESYDLVSEPALTFLEALEREIDATNIDIAIQLFVTITEYCQGPCPANQIALTHTKLCDAAKFILSHDYESLDPAKVSKLKEAVLTTLLSLLEGKADQLISRHMLHTLDFQSIENNIIHIISKNREKETTLKKRLSAITLVEIEPNDGPEDDDVDELQPTFLYFFLLCIKRITTKKER